MKIDNKECVKNRNIFFRGVGASNYPPLKARTVKIMKAFITSV